MTDRRLKITLVAFALVGCAYILAALAALVWLGYHGLLVLRGMEWPAQAVVLSAVVVLLFVCHAYLSDREFRERRRYFEAMERGSVQTQIAQLQREVEQETRERLTFPSGNVVSFESSRRVH